MQAWRVKESSIKNTLKNAPDTRLFNNSVWVQINLSMPKLFYFVEFRVRVHNV